MPELYIFDSLSSWRKSNVKFSYHSSKTFIISEIHFSLHLTISFSFSVSLSYVDWIWFDMRVFEVHWRIIRISLEIKNIGRFFSTINFGKCYDYEIGKHLSKYSDSLVNPSVHLKNLHTSYTIIFSDAKLWRNVTSDACLKGLLDCVLRLFLNFKNYISNGKTTFTQNT